MSSRLKVFSGKDVIKILESFNFFVAGQKGSHIKLKRNLPDGHSQSLTIPNHFELRNSLFCHSLEKGNPDPHWFNLDSRLRGNDRKTRK